MLTGLDESLGHQVAQPFARSGISDHRFFDRMLIGVFHPAGEAALVAGIGYYKNMNVADGFVMAQVHSRRQHNLRLSKALQGDIARDGASVGPLSIRILEPFREIHLTLQASTSGMSFDLRFNDSLPPVLERLHQGVLDGREHTNYQRFHQLGRVTGWMEVDGLRFDVRDWFSWRDHSWGVRPGVGGFEPVTGTSTGGGVPSAHRTGGKGLLLLHAGFWNGVEGGGIQILEDGTGKRIYTDGEAHTPNGIAEVTQVAHEIEFHPGTRIYSRVSLALRLQTGEQWSVEIEPMGRPLVYRGAGYDGGFEDGKGLGAWRGDGLRMEQDVYDVSDIEAVEFPNGAVLRPQHREQFGRVRVNGREGYVYTPFFMIGNHPRYGIAV